jgi:hypothetical protein
MASQIDNLRVKFNGLSTLAEKKNFITNLDAQMKKHGINNTEHKNFLSECIRKYNAEVNEKSIGSTSSASGSLISNTEKCSFSNRITGMHGNDTAECPLGHIPHPEFVPSGSDPGRIGWLVRDKYCNNKCSSSELNDEYNLLHSIAPNMTAKLPYTKRMWHYCPYIQEELFRDRIQIEK